MPVFLLFLGIYLCVSALAVWGLSRLLSRIFPRARAGWTATALFLAAFALAQAPTNCGFAFLLPMLLHDAGDDLRSWAGERKAERKQARLRSRFEGFLPVSAGGAGWRDAASGLVWSPAVGQVAAVSPEALAEAGAGCRAMEPAGYWALPRDADFYFLAKSGRAGGRWLAEVFLFPEEVSLPSLVDLSPRQGNPYPGQMRRQEPIQVRCVAVTPPAPARGYLSSDIPLEDWNRYQLGLTR